MTDGHSDGIETDNEIENALTALTRAIDAIEESNLNLRDHFAREKLLNLCKEIYDDFFFPDGHLPTDFTSDNCELCGDTFKSEDLIEGFCYRCHPKVCEICGNELEEDSTCNCCEVQDE
jgi:hypothetical protein